MSVPYGAWMGSIEQDAFCPPHDLCVEIQSFLAAHEHLLSRQTWNEVAVVYSVESEFQRVARRSEVANDQRNPVSGELIPFWQICDALCDWAQPYDVVFFPEGTLRPDALSVADFAHYRTVILPDCHFLTTNQAELLTSLLDDGKQLCVVGDLGTNLPTALRMRLLKHPGLRRVDLRQMMELADILDAPQVRLLPASDLMINLQRTGDGAAIHIIRYDFDGGSDAAPLLPELTLDVRIDKRFDTISLHSPDGVMDGVLERNGEWAQLRLRDVPLYAIVALTPAQVVKGQV
jgi:hypothetical protein